MSRQTLIDAAKKEVGYVEMVKNGKGNFTKYGEWFGLDGVPWCGTFQSWLYFTAGHQLPAIGYAKGFASCPAMLQWANTHGRVVTDPKPGDLVIFDWEKGKVTETEWSPDHVGMFEGWIDKNAGTFTTYEGNTSPANQSNGGMVQHRQRNKACVQAFISPLGLP